MSTTIPRAFAIKFRDDFIQLAQQKQSRLQRTVRQDPDNLDGKFGYFDRIHQGEVVEVASRHMDTPLVDIEHSRRRIGLRDFVGPTLIDKRDARRMIAAGQLPARYQESLRWAMNRKKDDLIIAAMTGDSFAIDEDDVATAVPLPAGQIVDVGVGGAGSGLNFTKILAAKEILNSNDVEDDEEIFIVLGPKQETDFWGITEATSGDFSTRRGGGRVLDMGKLNEVQFLGLTWLRSTRLTVDSTGTDRQIPLYTRTALGLAIGQDIEIDIGPRRDKNNSLQVLVDGAFDATRIEDEKLTIIKCRES